MARFILALVWRLFVGIVFVLIIILLILLKYTNMETKTFNQKNGTAETKLFGEETYTMLFGSISGRNILGLQVPPHQRAGVYNPTQDIDTMPCRERILAGVKDRFLRDTEPRE